MSNSFAIAAVTTTLQAVINQGLHSATDSVVVTTLTQDKAQVNGGGNQVNLLLYHAMPKLELGNQQTHPRGKPKGSQRPSLAMDLYYLVAAYGENGDEAKSHLLLGRVVQVLYDCTTLQSTDIEVATAREYPDSDLHRQVESLQITPVALTFDDMSKVWQVIQSPYRPSVAYKVSAVMIDSGVAVGSAMPVLTRSGVDDGPFVQLGLPPMITELTLPHRQPSARLGDRVTVRGEHLAGETVTVQLRHPLVPEPITFTPISTSEGEVAIALPTTLTSHTTPDSPPWLAGFWTLAVEVQHATGATRVSNEFPLAIAPTLSDLDPLEMPPGNLMVSVTCQPAIRPEQRVMLLWSDRTIPVYEQATVAGEASASRLSFRIREMTPGVYPVRLRVDGADSLPVDFATVPWQVDPNQQVRIIEP